MSVSATGFKRQGVGIERENGDEEGEARPSLLTFVVLMLHRHGHEPARLGREPEPPGEQLVSRPYLVVQERLECLICPFGSGLS